jgi:hypothetical protein
MGPGWAGINSPDKTVSKHVNTLDLYSQSSLWTTSVPKGPGWAGINPPDKTVSHTCVQLHCMAAHCTPSPRYV